MRGSAWWSDQWRSLRARAPVVDHLAKALSRYFADGSDRLAASITYYGFLCLFPLLLLAGSVVGFVVGSDPASQRELLGRLGDLMPDSLANRVVTVVTERAGITGVLGVVGLVIAGLGWVDALRESLRAVWHQDPYEGNVVVKKLRDVVILLGLGATVLLSLAVTALATSIAGHGLELIGITGDRPVAATTVLRLVGLALALASNAAILVYLLVWLPRSSEPLRRVLRAALVGSVALEVAKYVGFFYLGLLVRAGTDLYGGTLAAALGLLLWINIAARITMFTAAWAVTAAYREDVRPSGTAPPRPRLRARA